MTRYELYEKCTQVLDSCIQDLNNLYQGKKMTTDYSTIFYHLFMNDSQPIKVKSTIMEVLPYVKMPSISNILEAVVQPVSTITSDPIIAYRGFTISRREAIEGMKYLKTVLENENKKHDEKLIAEDENSFIDDLLVACKILQGNVLYYQKDENSRNDYIRDLLEYKGYIAKDQSRHGRSSNGYHSGEVDLIICNSNIQKEIIVEGLNLSDNKTKNKKSIEDHYDKILTKYDTTGNHFNVLLSYVTTDNFMDVVLDYKHTIEDYHFEFEALSVEVEKKDLPATMSILKSSHSRNSNIVYLYHVIVQLHS